MEYLHQRQALLFILSATTHLQTGRPLQNFMKTKARKRSRLHIVVSSPTIETAYSSPQFVFISFIVSSSLVWWQQCVTQFSHWHRTSTRTTYTQTIVSQPTTIYTTSGYFLLSIRRFMVLRGSFDWMGGLGVSRICLPMQWLNVRSLAHAVIVCLFAFVHPVWHYTCIYYVRPCVDVWNPEIVCIHLMLLSLWSVFRPAKTCHKLDAHNRRHRHCVCLLYSFKWIWINKRVSLFA